jgi:FixJ family two-component response regulator
MATVSRHTAVAVARDVPIVCIVDDDTSVRRALSLLLRGQGLRVEAYTWAEQFLRSVRAGQSRCAVLVLDIHLGATSGFELHDRLTALGVAIPTIFMTGRDDATTRERVCRAGAAAYLVKPFEDAALISAIVTALRAR